MKFPNRYFLVTHGSRDSRPKIGLEKLAVLVEQRLLKVYSDSMIRPVVAVGSLEFASISLAEQIQVFAEESKAEESSVMTIVPLFLLSGVHVSVDIPQQVNLAQQLLGNQVTIKLLPPLGSRRELLELLRHRQYLTPAEDWILLAHGSRREVANQAIEKLANSLDAVPAYWSVPPHLPQRVEELMGKGKKRIGILPYFLFAGGILDAINETVQELAQHYPLLELFLAPPLEATADLADVIISLIVEDVPAPL